MGRLSVSLGEDQQEWISAKAEELDLSKGKVVRECIDEVRTDSSLFSTRVRSTESGQSSRIETLEDRIESLEQAILDGATGAQSDEGSAGGGPDEEPSDSGQRDQDLEPAVAASAGAETSELRAKTGDTTPETGSSRSEGASNTTAEDDLPEELREHVERLPTDVRVRLAETDASEFDRSDPDSIRAFLDSVLDDGPYATVVFTCWKKLRQRGTLHVQSMKALYEEYPLGYEDEGAWWAEAIEPVLVLLPGVTPPKGGGNLYRFKY